MKERKSYQLAALGAGLMLLDSVVWPLAGFLNYLLGVQEAWWVLGMLVPGVLVLLGWLLQVPFIGMVRLRFHEQPGLWRYGMAAIVLNVAVLLLSGLSYVFPRPAGDFSSLSVPVLLAYLILLCSTLAVLLYSYFFTQLFTFCRRVQSRSALTFLPMAAAFVLLLQTLTEDVAFFIERPLPVDQTAIFMRQIMNFSCTFIAYLLLFVYFTVNIFKARS